MLSVTQYTADSTYLFVPGTRPDRFEKALASGADRVILDLEDAVSPADKDAARDSVASALVTGLSAAVLVRINPQGTQECAADLEAFGALPESALQNLAGIVIPKSEYVADLASVSASFSTPVPLILLIETAVGVTNALTLAQAPGVSRLALGAADYSLDLGIDLESQTIDYTYSKLVIASKAARLPGPIGSPFFSVHDAAGSEREARRLRALGVTAQLCIHPNQVAPVLAGFAPSPEDVTWALKMVGSDAGATAIDGQMVDRPVRERAELILARHARMQEP